MSITETLAEIRSDLKEVQSDVKEVIKNGCAKREGDVKRLDTVEKTLESLALDMRKALYALVVVAISMVAFLLKAFVLNPLLMKGP